MNFQNFFHFLFFGTWAYAVKIVLSVLGLIGLNYLIKRMLRKVRDRSLSKQSRSREKIQQIVHLPLFIALWIVGLTFVFNVLKEHFGFVQLSYIDTVRNSLLVVCGGWLCMRWIKALRHSFLESDRRPDLSVGTIHVLSRICSFAVATLTSLLVLQILGLNILPLLAFGGIGAATLGFAAKEVIANFFGGVMLYMTRPFTVGDTIMIPSKEELTGVVEEVGWYMTQVRDLEKRPVYLPNALFSATLIINLSQMTHRRILETLKLRLEDLEKLPALLDTIKTEILKHPQVDAELPFHLVLKEFGEHSLDLLIDGYTLATRYEEYLKVKQDLLLLIGALLKEHGAEFFLPKLELKTSNINALKELVSIGGERKRRQE